MSMRRYVFMKILGSSLVPGGWAKYFDLLTPNVYLSNEAAKAVILDTFILFKPIYVFVWHCMSL